MKSECGVVMPISEFDGCSAEHWREVRTILFSAIESAGLKPNLVSDKDDAGVIQRRIVENLYRNEIVVCDVSGRNPNVMFELGMRLAFDKPAVVVKDDKTPYSFDTSPVEHVPYPRDLRYSLIEEFREKLRIKLLATIKSKEDFSFLKSFGSFKVPSPEYAEVPPNDIVTEDLRDLKQQLRLLRIDLTSSGAIKKGVDPTLGYTAHQGDRRAEFVYRGRQVYRQLAEAVVTTWPDTQVVESGRDRWLLESVGPEKIQTCGDKLLQHFRQLLYEL